MSRMTYDPQADAAYYRVLEPHGILNEPNIFFPTEDSVILDVQNGRLIGVEILFASEFLGIKNPASCATMTVRGEDRCELRFTPGGHVINAQDEHLSSQTLTSRDGAWTMVQERDKAGRMLRLAVAHS